MLRIYRRHEKRCSLTSKADPNCPAKLKCPVWITGTLQDGTVVKPKTLNTRNWTVAAQRAIEMEAGREAGHSQGVGRRRDCIISRIQREAIR